jgi:hypothetical protein
MKWAELELICTFATHYAAIMALKRVHLGFNQAQVEILRKLSEKWGLSTSSTIRHCVMLIAETEGVVKAPSGKALGVR